MPNLDESEELTGVNVAKRKAEKLMQMGAPVQRVGASSCSGCSAEGQSSLRMSSLSG